MNYKIRVSDNSEIDLLIENKIRISSKLYDVALKKVNAPPAKELFLSQTFARASAYNEILLEELL
ncbi:MAG: hypothetical protein A2015_01995 [Spirochaetes bacterium GWF1_31_7]|nr:MAG: hypothetical protein A2Y30_05745 [Spirochaetes bacterium GWE1_32_154]OHD47447.1 MAG: hypothetical protein A2015_01995 [Spirochaetes bacterium GWF1_31_7]OHD49490.1 MAG: hypothetical protein A2Y29_01805 [Spirochaetes bacterium GWE2_31_10]OHD79689.1 MAG: hypothetical protein A2355_10240 [Spirochaetes bacterium RIFOXYB1_FULL_32_8]HBD96231.1 hypothetical protein [Spirochaetia bacterium]